MILVLVYLIFIIILAIIKKINIQQSFVTGVKDSYKSLLNLFPSILFLMIGMNIFINCGFIELIEASCERSKLIPEVIIQFILRPVSNSSSLIMMTRIFQKYGVDSFAGQLSSIIQASSDTIIYIIMVYFTTIKVKKIGHSLIVSLICYVIISIISFVVCYLFNSIF